ncbi:hypothetical protein QUA00_32380 [Microcoleus sp. T2B6]
MLSRISTLIANFLDKDAMAVRGCPIARCLDSGILCLELRQYRAIETNCPNLEQ